MTALLLLSHESADRVNRMTAFWREKTLPDQIVVAYGGPESEYDRIEGLKTFVDDPRLRTRDHQRECQSYTGVLQAAVATLGSSEWTHLYLAEFDILPIVPDIWSRLRSHAESQNADLLAHRLWQIDGSLHSHYGFHLSKKSWLRWIRSISIRNDKDVVLSCLGCGQFWKRETLESVVSHGEPVPAYLELHLPTVVHHLGFRVRGMGDQDQYVKTSPLSPGEKDRMIAEGAWIIHPEKSLWE
ncbi:MAG: hypothetical protein QM627_06500 [Luteolibacter sp.]